MAVHCRACPPQGCCTNISGTHLWEGAIKVVGAWSDLKAAPAGVLGEWQRGHQAHQLVAIQGPAAGVREEGAGSVQGVGGWRSVVVLQQGWQDTQLITPLPPPLFLQVGQLRHRGQRHRDCALQVEAPQVPAVHSPVAHRPPARRGSMPANRQTGDSVESVSLEGVRYHPARRV